MNRGEAFPQDPADASQSKRGEQGKEATRGQSVGDDQHEAGDREGDERGQEQVLGDPVQARPQEGRGEDAREQALPAMSRRPERWNSE